MSTRKDTASSSKLPRRGFLAATAATAAATAAIGPAFVKADDKSGTRKPILGSGEHTYEATHNWGTLPKHIHWGDTHGVVFDEAGLIYFTHQSAAKEPMDAIAVFDKTGQLHPLLRQGVPRRRPRPGHPQGRQGGVPLHVRHQELARWPSSRWTARSSGASACRRKPVSTRMANATCPRTWPSLPTAASTSATATVRASSINTTRRPNGSAPGEARAAPPAS